MKYVDNLCTPCASRQSHMIDSILCILQMCLMAIVLQGNNMYCHNDKFVYINFEASNVVDKPLKVGIRLSSRNYIHLLL